MDKPAVHVVNLHSGILQGGADVECVAARVGIGHRHFQAVVMSFVNAYKSLGGEFHDHGTPLVQVSQVS